MVTFPIIFRRWIIFYVGTWVLFWWQNVVQRLTKHIHIHRQTMHNNVVIMASQITSLIIVYSTVYSGADQRKHQSSASLAFVSGIHRWIPCTKGQQRGKVSVWWRHHGLCPHPEPTAPQQDPISPYWDGFPSSWGSQSYGCSVGLS